MDSPGRWTHRATPRDDTMTNIYRITNTTSGLDLGAYEGATGADAIRAMLDDAGVASDVSADPALVAVFVEVSDRDDLPASFARTN